MRSPALRWTTVGLFVAALIAAAYVLWTEESASRTASTAIRTFDVRAGSTTRAVMELRMAQQAYVAAGQGDEFWASKVSSQIAALREELTAIRALASAAGTTTAVETALEALADFERMDARAREYARSNQRLLASDIIFSDGVEKTDAILDALQQATTTETDAAEAASRAARQRQLAAAAGAGAAALMLGVILAPVPRQSRIDSPAERPAAETSAGAADGAAAQPAEMLPLRDVRDPVPPPVIETPPSIREAEPAPKDVFDLGTVAALCTEFARVVDTRALPALLERTAAVLDANGVVLWVADPDGRELNPIVTHGYPPHLVNRLGTIPREAQNATAAAFRTSLLQTVNGDEISHGAIAVPLLTPSGCVGVIAAEVRHGGEKEDAKLAAAAIVAAQLATLVGPPSARSQPRPEAARA